MRRKILLIHLFLAAFVAPVFLLVAISGGLYLLGVKGQVVSTEISLPAGAQLDFASRSLQPDIDRLLGDLGIEHEYQYLKIGTDVVQTRPTSRTYLQFSKSDGELSISRNQPDLQSSMIELHKGHGPTAFKTYQKLVALSLMMVVLSGLWMGLASPSLRSKTLPTAIAGLALFLVLAL